MMHLRNYTGPRDLHPQHVRAIIDAPAQRNDAGVRGQCERLATDQVYRLLAHDVRAYRWWQDYRLRNEGFPGDEAEADGWLEYYGSRIDGILEYLRG